MLKLNALCVSVALACAPANAACWSTQDTSAAKVRDLQTMLMVSALRCHAARFEIAADYNAFIKAAEPSINATNEKLRAHFRAEGGPVAGQRAYDRFTTALANSYGAGSTTLEDCNRAAVIARAAATAASPDALLRLANDTLFGSPVDACDAPVMAQATPAIVPAVMVATAPAPAPVVLAAAMEAGPAPAAPAAPALLVAAVAQAAPPATPKSAAPVELASATASNVLPVATAR